jgi:hypothetical protein
MWLFPLENSCEYIRYDGLETLGGLNVGLEKTYLSTTATGCMW